MAARQRQRRAVRDALGYDLDQDAINNLLIDTDRGIQRKPNLLETQIRNYEFNRANPVRRPPRQPRPKVLKLPRGYDQAESDALMRLIAEKKRDIKYLSEALTQQGAQNYIDRHGLGHELFVTDEDIDGDDVPDVIVKQRGTNLPIIVKGYRTAESDYPLRHLYYSHVPKGDRKNYQMKDYLLSSLGEQYGSATSRAFMNIPAVDQINNWKRIGYKKMGLKHHISIPQAFKIHIMKPIMKNLKLSLKDRNIPLNLGAQEARELETFLRSRLITIPAMKSIYGDDVMRVDEAYWSKLQARRDYKDAADRILTNLLNSAARDWHEIYSTVLGIIVQRLVGTGALEGDLGAEIAEEIVNRALQQIPQRVPEFGQELPPPEELEGAAFI
jgi:hypothetical protein